ncbi:MAG: hypothetical protein IH849_11150 [Acidobacteria bacterium]|nr:hypothetical protein [Acidobacteriota bacterium]
MQCVPAVLPSGCHTAAHLHGEMRVLVEAGLDPTDAVVLRGRLLELR